MIDIEVEPFSRELFMEILPLAQKCWEENTEQKLKTCAFYGDRDFAVEPQFDTYLRLHEAASLVILAMRADGKLVGYVSGILYNSWHHKGIKCGNADSIYIERDYRSYASVVVEQFENAMAEREVDIIGWPTTQGGHVYDLLKALGYVGDDIVMEKRLCV